MENQEEKNGLPEGFNPAPSQYFVGPAWVKTLVANDENTNCIINSSCAILN
jgi:hypothetical protein